MATEHAPFLYALALCISCSSADSSSAYDAAAPSGMNTGTGNTSNPGPSGAPELGVGASDAGTAPLPPEKELDQTFRAPVTTGKLLWSANPDSGRVALIDAQTLKVRITNAGFGPTYLAAVPGSGDSESAIVLNVGSHDATLLTATTDDINATTIDAHSDGNSWSVSDDGHFAIAWTDVTQIQGGPTDSVNGYSEISVIDLSATPPVATRLSVGFRPSQVVFDAQKQHAFAVVDEGISVIDLTALPHVSSLITLDSSGAVAHARDVNIAPDGSFAAVRVDGSADVKIVDLGSAAEKIITLESAVTDLDLSADGKSATAVLGNESPPKVVTFAVPAPASDPANFVSATVSGELVRSVTLAPDGHVALLYANAVPSSHLTLLNTAPGANQFQYRTVDLKGAIQRTYVAPDSQTAITFQLPPAGSTKKGIFSIVPTETVRSPLIVGTDAQPGDVAFSDAMLGKALVSIHDTSSSVWGVYVIGLANLEENLIPLSSEPLPGAIGIVPGANRGFVAQKHPEGRITFIDLDSGVAQTLTGFEIAARVVQ